jgi:hypothetical protein
MSANVHEPFGRCGDVLVAHLEIRLGDEVVAMIYVVPLGLFGFHHHSNNISGYEIADQFVIEKKGNDLFSSLHGAGVHDC